jgi:hypothetical protein
LRRGSKIFYGTFETFEAALSVFVDAYGKFGEAKLKYQAPVKRKPGNPLKKLHKYRDTPFSVMGFL